MSERERLARVCHSFVRHTDVQELEDWPTYLPLADAIFAEIEAAGYVLMERGRAERLIAYAVADQEYAQASTWAGIWSDDEVERKAVELQYAGREKRRREAHRAITLGDLDSLEGGE